MEDDKTDEVAAECSALDCDTDSLGCEHGLKHDEAGCDTCACHICSKVRCLMRCDHGFATDERNCPACQCAERKCTLMTKSTHYSDGSNYKFVMLSCFTIFLILCRNKGSNKVS